MTIEELYKLACEYGVEHAPTVIFEDPETGEVQFATSFQGREGYSIAVTENGIEISWARGLDELEIVEYLPHEGGAK